ncbi:Rab21/Rab5 family GTPase [Pelomyxa schiedti]|nr:Rab21/Rab5 family GTPase [Pelomyxa schiedti]
MAANNEELSAKVVVIGNSGCGKTSVSTMYVNGTFTTEHAITIGASFMQKIVQVGVDTLKLQIWDTAGQERFRSLTPMFYRESQAAIIVFDVTDRTSLFEVTSWLNELKQASTDIYVVVVGNKVDILPRVVTTDEGQQFVNSLPHNPKPLYFETSAKTGQGISVLFETVARKIVERTKMNTPNTTTNGHDGSLLIKPTPANDSSPDDGCC